MNTNNNAISLSYYPDGRLWTITDPSGGRYTFIYKTWTVIINDVTKTDTRLYFIQGPAGRKVIYDYDVDKGYFTSRMDPLQNITRYGHTTDTGRLNYIEYPEGYQTTYTYDNMGNLQTLAKKKNGIPYTTSLNHFR